jgi:hypothetical protein
VPRRTYLNSYIVKRVFLNELVFVCSASGSPGIESEGGGEEEGGKKVSIKLTGVVVVCGSNFVGD